MFGRIRNDVTPLGTNYDHESQRSRTESQTINIHFHDMPDFRDLMLADLE